MYKRIFCLISVISILLLTSTSLTAAAGEETSIIKFCTENADLFSIGHGETSSTGVISIADDMYVLPTDTRGFINFWPYTPIEITTPDFVIKYKVKIEYDSGSPSSIYIRSYGATEPGGSSVVGCERNIASGPASGQWYEGSFWASDMSPGTGYRLYKEGDLLTRIGVDIGGNGGNPYTLFVEYVELMETVPKEPEERPNVRPSTTLGKDGETSLGFFTPGNEDYYTIRQYSGDTIIIGGPEDALYECTTNTRGYVMFYPDPQFEILKRSTLIRYKTKVDYDPSVLINGYFAIRFTDTKGEVEGSITYIEQPVSGQWYEGELDLSKMSVSGDKRAFEIGDKFSFIGVDFANPDRLDAKFYIEYVEIVDPPVDTAPPAYNPPPINEEMINEVVAQANSANPGDVIYIEDGFYTSVKLDIDANGAEGQPVTIKARNPGKAIFNGKSSMTISGQYIVVDGLYFTDGWAPFVIDFSEDSSHCRLTNTAIINYNNPYDDTVQSRWVLVRGTYNKIDHCYFREKMNYGKLLDLYRSNDEPKYHTVEYNYFGYIYYNPAGVSQPFGIGDSTTALSDASCTVQYNFWERCAGNDEVVSNKSCGNTYSYNTFYDNDGALTLRHGFNNTVNGNLFIGGTPSLRATGLRVVGAEHKIYDNYFYGLSLGATALTLENGVVPGAPNGLHEPMIDLDLHNNTFIGNDLIRIGADAGEESGVGWPRNTAPEGKVYNNIFLSLNGKWDMFTNEDPSQKLEFTNNIAYGKPLGGLEGIAGIRIEDPCLQLDAKGFLISSDAIGADVSETDKAPKHPTEITPDWITEMYSKGELTFTISPSDPFNTDPVNWDASLDTLVFAVGVPYAYKNALRMTIDEDIPTAAPVLVDDCALAPARFIADLFRSQTDYDFEWDSSTLRGTIRIRIPDMKYGAWRNTMYTLSFSIGDNNMTYIRSYRSETITETIELDVPPALINGIPYIPLQACAEALLREYYQDDRGLIVISGGASVGEYVKANPSILDEFAKALGISVIPEALVSITGPETVESGAGATVNYVISAENMPPVSGIELEFEVDGDYLASKAFTALSGFNILDAGNYGTPIYWKNNGNVWTGKATLLDINTSGINGDLDLFNLEFYVKEGVLGEAAIKLNYVRMSFTDGSVGVVIVNNMALTEFTKYYSRFDLNKDEVIDLNDLTYALQFLLAKEGDANWEQAIQCDYNGDKVVDINDLILILANYTIPYYD